jgi:zinc protease
VAFCFALALGFSSSSAWAQAANDPLDAMQSTVLENGLTVLTLEDHASPVASFQIWVDVGSSDEARFTGIAHLFEHMMFRGSKNLAKEVHSQIVEARGGRINASTSNDVTRYFEDVPSEHLPVVIALEAERFKNLIIDEDSLASEREVVISERRWRTEDSPDGRAFEQLMASAFLAHPYRHPVVGWLSDLEKVDVEVCRAFFDTYYAANNLVISVAGDFDTETTLAQIRNEFGGLRRADEIPRNPTEEPRQLGERRSTVHFDVAGPLLTMAWHAPPTGHEDAEALDVLSGVLSGGRTSRLYRNMVYAADAVALSAQGVYFEMQQAGLFYAGVQVRPGQSIERAETEFLAEIERIRREAPDEAEVDRARRAMEVSLIVGAGSAHALGSRMGREWTNFGRIRPLSERLENVRSVTPEDVRRVAAKYLVPEGRTVVRVVPPPETDAPADPTHSGDAS